MTFPCAKPLDRRALLVAAAAAPLMAACAAAEPVAGFALQRPVHVGNDLVLIKDWDFRRRIRTMSQLKDEFYTRYAYADGTLDHLNDEWQRYRDKDNHVFNDTGLALVARAPKGFAPGAVESGMLRSRWTGQYGYFEISMRAPKGRGLWPAFWLNPDDKTWPPEIDIVEIVNDSATGTRNSFHFLHGAGAKKMKTLSSKLNRFQAYTPGEDFSEGFHRFAVDWSAKGVKHYVDDVMVAEREYRWIHNNGADAGPAHVLVNLAVGGKWPGAPSPDALPASLDIEYIRVWQSPPN